VQAAELWLHHRRRTRGNEQKEEETEEKEDDGVNEKALIPCRAIHWGFAMKLIPRREKETNEQLSADFRSRD
jgi:hypothetical protein